MASRYAQSTVWQYHLHGSAAFALKLGLITGHVDPDEDEDGVYQLDSIYFIQYRLDDGIHNPDLVSGYIDSLSVHRAAVASFTDSVVHPQLRT